MPPDFDPAEHSLNQLAVACRHGVVFASFDHQVEPLEDFLGADILHYFDRVFDGRELVVHGYSRQRIGGNWKLMQENIKDPRSEEHTSELQSLMRISYAVFCLKKKI